MIRVVLLLVVAVAARAQVASSSLLGEIRDQSSALVPGAVVTAVNDATGFSRAVLSNTAGGYRIDELVPGTYTVKVMKPRFRPIAAGAVALQVNQTAKLDFTLEVGAEHDEVAVRAAVSPLDASDPSVGYQLDSRLITSLPLAGRDVVALMTLGPGVIPRQLGGFVHDIVNDIQEGARGSVALNPPVNGSRSTMNGYLLDGANDTDRNTNAIAVMPPMEAVQEFRLQSSLPSAAFAQAGGGLMDVVSKSGGLAYHGSGFEMFRNEALDAHNYFDDPSLPRPIVRQSQFGGSLGGPLPIPSTFFFATYEGLRGKSAKATSVLVPDATIRTGNFVGQNPIFDPLSIDPVTGARQQYPGNVIPQDRLDPIAMRYLASYEPLPNKTGGSGNYLDGTPNNNVTDNVSARVDHEFGDHSWLYARYTMNDQRDSVTTTFPELPTSERLRAQQAATGYTISGPAWLNEARLSFTRLRLFDVPQSVFQNVNVAQKLGISNPPTDPLSFGLPYFLVTNYSTVTDSPTLPQTQRDNLWNFSDGVSLVRGRHTWKFGFNWVHSQLNYMRTQYVRGQYTYTGAFTSNFGAANTGDPFADFLLGFPQNTNRTLGSSQAYLGQSSYAGYVQHDWQATRRLTLNFGARYEYTSPFREANGDLLNLDYSTLPAAPRLIPAPTAVQPNRKDIAPRAGLAWRLPERFGRNMVFRAGYGVYFSQEIAAETYDLILNGIRTENNVTNGSQSPILTTQNGFPQTASTGFPSYYGVDRNAPTPYVQQWTASFQRELPGQIVAEVGYVGSKGTHLGRFRRFNTPLNALTANLAPRPGDIQSLRPFPELGTIFQRQNIANSSYNSLQVKVEKKFSGHLALLASFVWAKSIDDADSVIPGLFDSVGAQDERNLRLDRGLSFFNVGRRVSAGFVYDIPKSAFLRPLLSNWSLSGIVTLQDGTPLNPVYFAFDPANSGTPNRPDVVPGQSVKLPRSQQTIERFFNTAAFQAPQPFHLGTAGRNILPGPGNNVFDLALHRRFPIRERAAIEFRAESFNAFNHPNWGIPGQWPDFGPFFGRILATGDPRRAQAVLRFDF